MSPDGGAGTNGPVVDVVPPEAAALIASVKRTPPNNSGALLLSLEPLVGLSMTPLQAAVIGMGRFPVGGFARWADDWLEPRFGSDGSFHFHTGNDLVADCGVPLRSPTDGVLTIGSDPGGGNTVEVTQSDKTYFYLAHLSAYVAGQTTGQQVHTGDVIGFVGQSGAATGCHLHFEIHPLGGGAIDPKPFVDAWVADAVARAPALIAYERSVRSPPAARPATTTTTAAPDRLETLLFASAANPTGGALALAQVDAADAVHAAGADQLASRAVASALEWTAADLAAAALLDPTTPPVLRPFLDGVIG